MASWDFVQTTIILQGKIADIQSTKKMHILMANGSYALQSGIVSLNQGQKLVFN